MKLSKKAQLEIQRLRAAFPQQLAAQVARSAEGGFVASVISIPGAQTQADTFSELLDMINDRRDDGEGDEHDEPLVLKQDSDRASCIGIWRRDCCAVALRLGTQRE